MFTFHNISRSFYFIQEMPIQINMKNVTTNIIISQRHVGFTIKTLLTFNLFTHIYIYKWLIFTPAILVYFEGAPR